MEQATLNYELIPETSAYRIKDFDLVLERVKTRISEAHIDHVIENDWDFKEYKKRRAALRKVKDQVGLVRRSLIEAITGQFESECKQIEYLLDEADKKMKKSVDDYANKDKAPQPPVYTITISSEIKGEIEKIRQFFAGSTVVSVKVNYELEEQK